MEHKDYGEEVAKQIDEEVRVLIDTAHDTAQKILLENRSRLIHLAEKLVIAETLEGPELEKAFTEPIPPDEEQQTQEHKLQPPKIIGVNLGIPKASPSQQPAMTSLSEEANPAIAKEQPLQS